LTSEKWEPIIGIGKRKMENKMTKTFKLNNKKTLKAMLNKSIKELRKNVDQEENDLNSIKEYVVNLERVERTVAEEIKLSQRNNYSDENDILIEVMNKLPIIATIGVLCYVFYFIKFVF
jgi:ribosomal protein S13